MMSPRIEGLYDPMFAYYTWESTLLEGFSFLLRITDERKNIPHISLLKLKLKSGTKSSTDPKHLKYFKECLNHSYGVKI